MSRKVELPPQPKRFASLNMNAAYRPDPNARGGPGRYERARPCPTARDTRAAPARSPSVHRAPQPSAWLRAARQR